MPIRAENKHRYPREWPLISLWVRVCAGWRCEWCDAQQGQPHPITGSKVVLTVAHLVDMAPENCAPTNLAALCQKCHLGLDRDHHIAVGRANRRAALRVPDMLAALTGEQDGIRLATQASPHGVSGSGGHSDTPEAPAGLYGLPRGSEGHV